MHNNHRTCAKNLELNAKKLQCKTRTIAMDSRVDTKSNFIKLFEIKRIIDNESVSSNKIWIKLVDCLEENQLKTILSAGIGQLANNSNSTDQSQQVIDKINAILLTFQGEKKKPSSAIHNATGKVFCIQTLHFKINEYLDFKSLMRLCRVNSEWLHNAYKPQSQYKFNTRQCHVEYIPPRNDAAEPYNESSLRKRRKCKTDEMVQDIDVEIINATQCVVPRMKDHHIPGLGDGRGIYNILRFSKSKILVIHRWHAISNGFYSNLVYFNKIEQLDIRYSPRYEKYTYRDEQVKEFQGKKRNNTNTVGFYGVLSMIMNKNFHHLSRLTFYQSLSIDLDAWKLFFNDKNVDLSNIKYFAIKQTRENRNYDDLNEDEKFNQQDKLQIQDKIIPRIAQQLAKNIQELEIKSCNTGNDNEFYWVPYFLSELLSHVTKNKDNKNNNLQYVSVNTAAGYGFDANDIKRCQFAFKDSKNLLKCITINLYGNMNNNEIDNVTKIFMANDLKSKRSDELGIICQKLEISRIFHGEPKVGDRNVLLCQTIVKLLKRMNEINLQCLNKNLALKGLKKLYIGKFMYENSMTSVFELFDEIDRLPMSLKEIKVEVGQRKIGNFYEENRYNMNEMIPTLEDLERLCDILQQWASNHNQLKKCEIELSACCIEDLSHYSDRLGHRDFFDILTSFDFDDIVTKWHEVVGDEVLVEKLGFIELDEELVNNAYDDDTYSIAWYTNTKRYNQIKANIQTVDRDHEKPTYKMCLRLTNF